MILSLTLILKHKGEIQMIIEREQKGNKYSKPIITEQHIEFIKEKYNEGLSQVSIAKLMNVSDRMIRDVMKKTI